MSKAFFWVLHFLSRWMLRLYYPAMETENVEVANRPGPMLLCGNHPNTLADPLIVGIHLDYQTYFLANAGLWLNPVMAFIIDPFCIPVARAKDKEAGADKGGREEVFNRTFAGLETRKNIYIAPEAYSELERKLRRIKSGAASMALAVEERNGWKLGVRLQPVGVNYESPTTCFSRAFIRYGAPIIAADYREQFEKSPMRAIRALTDELSRRMQGLLIHTSNKEEERLLRPIERAVQHDHPLTVSGHHFRTQAILTWLRDISDDTRNELREVATGYEATLRETGQLDIEFSRHPDRRLQPGTLLGLPFFLYGLINHAAWLGVITAIVPLLGVDRGYKATLQMLGSWFLLPLFYGLQTGLFNALFPDAWGWLYFLSLPVSGLFGLKYWLTYRAFWAGRFSGARTQDARLEQDRERMLAFLPAHLRGGSTPQGKAVQ